MDLLFFPTGGGKTEAYLGLAAFAMVLRRLRHPDAHGRAGAGVSVIMRYTLRLLTLDQLARASGLVCALELERAEAAGRYGDWPFEIGLWVGKAATPNLLGKKRGRALRLGAHQGQAVQSRPERKAVPGPAGKLPLVRRAVRTRLVRAAAQRRPAARVADRVHELRVRVQRRPCVADPGRRRAGLPAPARLPDRHGGQVRVAALDGTLRRPSGGSRPV